MDFNIWDGGAKTAKIRKAKAKLEESYKELSLLKRTAEQNLAVARGALKTTIKIMPILQEKLESIEAAASDYAVQFNRGRRQISGLLDTRKEFYEAKASVVDLQMTQIYTAFQVLAAKGTLINHLKVKTN
jgi:adhesin transport system outer membrane protein